MAAATTVTASATVTVAVDGGDYFIGTFSIFFILGSLCPERYNKSLCKTRFTSTLPLARLQVRSMHFAEL